MTTPVQLTYPGATVDTLLETVNGSNLSATHKITRSATIVVAASNSSAKGKAQADYVCDGTADNVEIQAALDALPNTGGEIHLLDGTYQLAATVSRAIDNVTWSGCGYSTYIKNNSTARLISIGVQGNWVIRDMRLDYGGIEFATGTKWSIRSIWRDVPDGKPAMYIDKWSDDHISAECSDNIFSEIAIHPMIKTFSDFETDVWTNANGTFTYDTTIKYKGTRSAKVVTPEGTQVYLLTSQNLVDFTNCSFSIMCYVEDYTKLSSIELDIKSTEEGWVHYGKWDATAIQHVNAHWFKIVFPYMTVGAGSPNYTDPNLLRLRIKPVAEQSATVYLDDFRYWVRGLTPKGAVSFTFDDGLASTFQIAKPIMDVYGYPGVWGFVINRFTSTILANAKHAQLCGWDIVSHSYDHNAAKTASEPKWQYLLSQKWLADNGFKSGARFALLHGGLHNTAMVDILNSNLQIARCSLNGYESLPGIGNLVMSYTISYNTTSETIKGWIDTAIAQGLWVNLMFHGVVAANATGYDCLSSVFQEVVDYCNSTGVEVLSYSQIIDRIRSSAQTPTLSGTGTITNGTTSVNIRHGFHKAPSSIQVTPTSSLGSAASLWVSSKDTGTGNLFTVSVNANPGQDVTFEWVAVL